MGQFFRHLYRSFPIQLLLLHFRSNLILLLTWLLLIALIGGYLGFGLGFQYFFLDPEYLGKVRFISFLIMGLTFGFFVMSWNLTTYLLTARYFGFLACLARPFLKFSINNALLPLAVLAFYSTVLFRFNARYGNGWELALYQWSALIAGIILSLLLYMIYFYLTNRDIYYYTGRRPAPPNLNVLQPFGRQIGQSLDAVQQRENPYRVRSYLNNALKTRLVRSVAHYDRSQLEEVFRQNHWNAFFLQGLTLSALIFLGLFIDYPIFQLPAGASIFIALSFLIFILGSISYWFGEWSTTVLVLIFIGIELFTSLDTFNRSNFAFGINYEQPAAEYSEKRLRDIVTGELPRRDSLAGIELLNNWKARQPDSLPPLIILSASGGGLTASVWSVVVTQELERHSGKKVLPATVLMTGASGGMLGMAYLREIYRRSRFEPAYNHVDPSLLGRAAADLLNPIAFSIVSNDLFLPLTEVQIGDETYLRDRAYGFEQQLNNNTNLVLDLPLSAYREAEEQAIIPQLLLTPSIVNDGRRLLVSACDNTHLMIAPSGKTDDSPLYPDAVDLGALLGPEQRDSLRFLTALRMNATYPYVLPFVNLPTSPTIQVMDAGYRDNYGILTAGRYLQVYQDWIRENTSRVILIQISAYLGTRDSRSDDPPQGLLASLLTPIGLAGNFFTLQYQEQDNTLGYLYEVFGDDHFDLVRFNYQVSDDSRVRPSVSFHLTSSEKEEIIGSIKRAEYQKKVERVTDLLRRPDQ